MAARDKSGDDQDEPLSEEERIALLETQLKKRTIILMGIGVTTLLLLLFFMVGFLLQHSRISDLELASEALTEQVGTIGVLNTSVSALQTEVEGLSTLMGGGDGESPKQRFQTLERQQMRIVTVQGNLIETLQAFLLSLSRMSRGTSSWSEDFKLYMDRIKEQNTQLQRVRPKPGGETVPNASDEPAA